MFKEEKTTQIASYLLNKAGGTMSHLKLMKLIYLADRFSYQRYGKPISGDLAVSMNHGPVLSATYDLMKGVRKSEYWNNWISPIINNELSLNNQNDLLCFDLLSKAVTKILDEVFAQFGYKTTWEIRDDTHEFPEWEDPKGSSKPIPVSAILRAVGINSDMIERILVRLEENDALDRVLASL